MFIERELYSKIHEVMPIPCIDLVVMRENKILLVHRKEDPAKGQYWFPGGRIFRGESFQDAAKRLIKSEVGLDINKFETIGTGNLIFEEEPFGHGKGTHTVTFIMKCQAPHQEPVLDRNHSGYIWWGGTTGHHPYVLHFADEARKV